VHHELYTDLSTAVVDNAPAPDGRPAAAGPVLRVAIDMPRFALFDYLPPSGFDSAQVPPGARVRVPMGTRECIGVVVEQAAQPSVSRSALKAIRGLIDTQPLLDSALMRLLRWTAQYYHHPLGEVIAAALPNSLRQGAPAVPSIELWRPTAQGLTAAASQTLRRAPRQQALLRLLCEHADGLTPARISDQSPSWREAARTLEARGLLERCEAPASEPAPCAAHQPDQPPSLSGAQSAAVARIEAARGTFAAFVLQGATGSGKSEVYLQCAARTLARGHSTLVLVPEIALTPQLIERFRRRLPCEMAVLHSGLSDAERLAAWRDARSDRARIVLGTRSAVFAPMPRLGLIVVDEEHDSSYKQHDGGCRYSARDVSVARAQQAQIPVVLGSATPSFETLHNLSGERYQRLCLPRRIDQPEAPRLALIDLRAHAVTQGLSTPVIDAMRRHLQARGQVLVFINRRGYAPTLLCTACGWIAPCGQCDARLTVHRAASELRCHHCGALEPLPQRCRRCGFAVKPVGQGTERVEETLTQLFPTDADQGLVSTDFRAAERLAQTIVQVAGRAGREHSRGEVLIQTEYPEHPLLQSLLAGGYEGFAAAALCERAAAQWPPFGRLALLRASALELAVAMQFLCAARAAAPEVSDVRLLGPVPAAMARRAGRHYAQLLLESRARAPLHRLLDEWLPRVAALPQARRVRYALDVDPLDIQ
jgi:primosomal protein N' (replication factor Y)